MRTGVDGNARPSSSAVRDSPTTGARRPRWPHSAQAQAGWSVPHQRQRGAAAARAMVSGPRQAPGRPGSGRRCGSVRRPARRRSRRGVCTSTGPVVEPLADHLVHQRRHPRAAGERVAGQLGSLAPATRTVTRSRSRSRGARARGPSRTGAGARPRRCGRSRPAERRCPRARRAAAGSRGCGGTAPAARRAGRRRRPRSRPGRGRAPARRRPRGCRPRRAAPRGRPPGSRGSARAGPARRSALTWWPSPSTSLSARPTRSTSLASGTQISTPRPDRRTSPRRRGRAAAASRRPAARPRPPAGTPPRRGGAGRRRPAGARPRQRRPRPRRRRLGSAGGVGSARSVAAWRGGTASRRTSARVPAYRSATSPARAAIGRAQHRLGADHPPQRGEPAGVVGGGGAGHDVAVDLLPGEPHLHPRPGHGHRSAIAAGTSSRTAGRGGPAGTSTSTRATGSTAAGSAAGGLRGARASRLGARRLDGLPEAGQGLGLLGEGRSRPLFYQQPAPGPATPIRLNR